ncbi:Co2 transporter containing CBS domains [hydrothermal vent metagenome]|uniref:Co2 transporter containing CBS domains n=1 Tax=hydrothermal vent metagenome TaxID=652676 RepID=A0A3B0R6Z3_9ZZZZ
MEIMIFGGSVFLLLLLSAFFSGSETALTAASKARLHKMEHDGVRGAKRVNQLIADRESLIGSILLGNNLVNILASALTTTLFLKLFGPVGVLMATVVMTVLVLVFAEVAPKTYAISNPDRTAILVSGPIKVIKILFAPVVMTVEIIIKGMFSLFGIKAEGPVLSAHDELRGAVEYLSQQGEVIKHDRDMIGGVLDLQELSVEEIMVHRKNITMVDASQKAADVVGQVLQSQFTRLPLFDGSKDNITGILHVRDLLGELHRVGGDYDKVEVEKILRPPWFTPETTTVPEQLNAFRSRREHFALVVDEYGALMGLVTLEDIIEEIIGEIEDEYDKPTAAPRRIKSGILVAGDLSIRDLNREQEWNISDEDAVTVAGLIIHHAQAIPEAGQIFSIHGFRFEILERKRNQITKVKIRKSEG